MTPINIIEANLDWRAHTEAIRALTYAYALDAMGNDGPLPEDVLARLIPGLKDLPTTLVFLAYLSDEPVGIATCFRGFSTFHARPLLNIQDFAVLPAQRGQGIGQALLEAVERKARQLGSCKVTLEVQENNVQARRVYEQAGFSQAVYGKTTGGSLHYWKLLVPDRRRDEGSAQS